MSEVLYPRGKLNLAAAAALHSELGALKGRDVAVDLSDVTQLGALCLQVMIAAAKTAGDAGSKFRINGASARVTAQLDTMGMPPNSLTEAIK